ncbi:MAG: hypothetical protein QOH89_3592 [Pseudonocardiales bacterium]|nr:hypothetical protein [Pseudonocardiales bacterium]
MNRFGCAAVALLALAGCTSSGSPGPTTNITHTQTTTSTRPPPQQYKPPKPAFRHPLPPGTPAPKGERDHSCPYIKAGLNVTDDTGVNLANLEGDRVYRITLLTDLHPVGCRFYFYAPPYAAIAEIEPHRFKSAHEAYDAMILTARTGHNLIPEKNFVHGLTGICFQTKFFAEDGARDWAFVFAKGKTMVVVYAFQTNTSRNALYIARAIAGKF